MIVHVQYHISYRCACMHARLLQLCPTLCNPKDCSPPGPSVLGILQARILECFAVPASRESSCPRDWTHVSYVSVAGRFFTTEPQWKPISHVVVYICHFWEHFIGVSSWTQIPPWYALWVTEIISSRARTIEVKTGWNNRSLIFYIFFLV